MPEKDAEKPSSLYFNEVKLAAWRKSAEYIQVGTKEQSLLIIAVSTLRTQGLMTCCKPRFLWRNRMAWAIDSIPINWNKLAELEPNYVSLFFPDLFQESLNKMSVELTGHFEDEIYGLASKIVGTYATT